MPYHFAFSRICIKCLQEIGAPKTVKSVIERPCGCRNLLDPDEVVKPDAAIVLNGDVYREIHITADRGLFAKGHLGKLADFINRKGGLS